MKKQEFEVYAVPKKSAYVLTPEQVKQLEEGNDRSRAIRERNARIFEKINLRVSREPEQGYEPGE